MSEKMRVPSILFALITFVLMICVRSAVLPQSTSRGMISRITGLRSKFGAERDGPLSKIESNEKNKKLGVLMLNLGGPEKQEDVEGFLYNLFADPDIIRLPKLLGFLQKPIATYISKQRSPKSREAYQSIGGGSPILKYTNEQARGVEEQLRKKGYNNVKCFIGMRYWHPFTEEALDEIAADEIESLVILPLYPQYSISTSGSSFRVLKDIFNKNKKVWLTNNMFKHTTVPYWYDRPGYVKLIAKLIKKELKQFTRKQLLEEGGQLNVLFSAHGVPNSYIEAGDPYKRHIEECVSLISQYMPSNVKVHLSFQSRVGPVEWLRPFTDDKLRQLGNHMHSPLSRTT
jgi:protoporphyrin/coproporphyrin ferrochelatase